MITKTEIKREKYGGKGTKSSGRNDKNMYKKSSLKKKRKKGRWGTWGDREMELMNSRASAFWNKVSYFLEEGHLGNQNKLKFKQVLVAL